MIQSLSFFTNDGIQHDDIVKKVKTFNRYLTKGEIVDDAARVSAEGERFIKQSTIASKETIEYSMHKNILPIVSPMSVQVSTGSFVSGEWTSELGGPWYDQWIQFETKLPTRLYHVSGFSAGVGDEHEVTSFKVYYKHSVQSQDFLFGGQSPEVTFSSASQPLEMSLYLEGGIEGTVFRIIPTTKKSYQGIHGSFQVRLRDLKLYGFDSQYISRFENRPFGNLRSLDFGTNTTGFYGHVPLVTDTDRFSWFAWVNFEENPSWVNANKQNSMMSIHCPDTQEYIVTLCLYQTDENQSPYLYWTVGQQSGSSSSFLEYKTWYHVGFSVDQTSFTLYVDGAIVTQSSVSMSNIQGKTMYVGKSSDAQSLMHGLMYEVVGYDDVLSSQEVTALYENGGIRDVRLHVPGREPIFYYRFESSDIGRDTMGVHADITWVGIPTISHQVPVRVETKFPVSTWHHTSSIFFNGVGSFALSSIHLPSVYSISLWLSIATSAEGPLLSVGERHHLLIENNELKIESEGETLSTGHVVATGSWRHIVVCRDGNAFHCYVDGVSKHTVAFSSVLDPSGSLLFGTRQGGFLEMFLDEIAVFSSLLTDEDVHGIYNSGSPFDLKTYSIGASSTMAYWTFENITFDDYYDENTQVIDRYSNMFSLVLESPHVYPSSNIPVYESYGVSVVPSDGIEVSYSFDDDQALRIGAWIYVENTSSDTYPLIYAGDNHKAIYDASNEKIIVRSGNDELEYDISRVYMLNQWHHIFIIWDTNVTTQQTALYIDGTKRTSMTQCSPGWESTIRVM